MAEAPAQDAITDGPWLTGRADLFATSRDMWRGIRRNAQPAIQADAMGGVFYRGVSLTAGGWGSLVAGDTRREARPELRVGTWDWSEFSLWGQVAYRTPAITASVGVMRNTYVGSGLNPEVTEAYGTVRLQRGRWSSQASVWAALDGAEGAYIEPSVSFHHFVNPFAGPAIDWTTTLYAGLQAGLRRPAGGAAVPGAEGEGLTHVGLGSAIRGAFSLGEGFAVVARLEALLQVNRDAATQRGRDGNEADFRFTCPLQLGFSWPSRRSE